MSDKKRQVRSDIPKYTNDMFGFGYKHMDIDSVEAYRKSYIFFIFAFIEKVKIIFGLVVHCDF